MKDFDYPNTKIRLQVLSELRWPKFGVNLPPENTFDPQLAWAIVGIVHRNPVHSDQVGLFYPELGPLLP